LARWLAVAPDAIVVADRAGCIVLANAQTAQLFGYEREALLGQPVEVLLPERFRANHLHHRTGYTAAPRTRPMGVGLELYGRRQDGSEFPVEISLSPVEVGGDLLIMSAIRDISARKQAEDQVRGLLEFAPDAMVVIGDDGRVVLVNAQTERLFGYSREELVGQPIELLVPERFHHAHLGHRTGYTHQPRVRPMGVGLELYGRRKDGSEFPVEISLSPFATGGQTLFLSAVRDITERKQAEDARLALLREQSARAEAEAASAAKDEFLSILSHELRTPLTPIVAYCQLLLAGRLTGERAREALETIARSAQVQARLVEDVLDVSRIITGKLTVEREPVDLFGVITAAVETVRPLAQTHQVAVATRLDAGVGLVLGDVARLQQVVWNLLSNAIKFTPAGGRVAVTLEAVGTDIRVIVTDTGVGIPTAFLPHLFERFRQADSSTVRQQGGLGLGLAIVRHLVDQHKGTVEATSPGDGQGATFTVTLPRLTPIGVPSGPHRYTGLLSTAAGGAGAGRLAGLRVLVVEDHPDTRELLRLVLAEAGAQVTAVGSAAAALAVLTQAQEPERPDVLVSDIGLPGQDGYELLAAVRAGRAGAPPTLPAVALTAYASEADRQRAVAAGYQLHLAKPVEPDRVVAAVATLVGPR
jgi:PAS domain S-box-containing protein